MEAVAPPNVLPLTDKGCIFPNSPILLGPFPNYTAQYPDQVDGRTFFGCDNTTNVSKFYPLSRYILLTENDDCAAFDR
jgi:hypothetical protein